MPLTDVFSPKVDKRVEIKKTAAPTKSVLIVAEPLKLTMPTYDISQMKDISKSKYTDMSPS